MNRGFASISVVIPVYNSADLLPELIGQLEPVLQSQATSYELILVEDGSIDDSWEKVREAAQRPWVTGVQLMRNSGQHNALLCGIRRASGEVVITMDDDLQHPPAAIPKLLDALTDEFDVVYGTPSAQQHGAARNVASTLTKVTLQKAMGADSARHVSAFRAFRTTLRDSFADYSSQFVSVDVLLTWGTTRFTHTTVEHNPRFQGTSTYTVGKLLTHSWNMLTGFSSVPLQLASIIGFTFLLFGVGVLAFVVGRQLFFLQPGESVPGFTFLASIVTIFAGAQLFALGVIGEYLSRMHFRMMDRPAYGIREIAGQIEKD